MPRLSEPVVRWEATARAAIGSSRFPSSELVAGEVCARLLAAARAENPSEDSDELEIELSNFSDATDAADSPVTIPVRSVITLPPESPGVTPVDKPA